MATATFFDRVVDVSYRTYPARTRSRHGSALVSRSPREWVHELRNTQSIERLNVVIDHRLVAVILERPDVIFYRHWSDFVLNRRWRQPRP